MSCTGAEADSINELRLPSISRVSPEDVDPILVGSRIKSTIEPHVHPQPGHTIHSIDGFSSRARWASKCTWAGNASRAKMGKKKPEHSYRVLKVQRCRADRSKLLLARRFGVQGCGVQGS